MIPFLLLIGQSLPFPNSFPFVIPWNDSTLGVATDVSALNPTPAGKNGRIVARNGHFYEQVSGRRIRFLGTNLAARAAFPSHEDADRIALRMAKLGINLVRLHHLQNDWDAPSGGSIWREDRPFQDVDPAQMDKLDYLIGALKRRGIYTNLNLSTTRRYLPEMGFPPSVLDVEKLGGTFSFMKKIDKVDRRMIDLQKEYAKALLARTNPYTGRRYSDEPALAFVEINNENSLVGWPGEAVGTGLSKLPEPFRGEVESRWNEWLIKTYRDEKSLRAAWGSEGPKGSENASGSEPEGPDGDAIAKRDLPLAGQSSPIAMRDYARFLADTETAYADEMRVFLREDLGIKANLIDTQISWGGLTALQRESGSDYADNHFYWQHPAFGSRSWDPKEWTIGQKSILDTFESQSFGALRHLALSRVAGKPYSVSEYNHPAPNDYRVEMMPILASLAALQDWDAIYTFDYGWTGSGAPNDRMQGFFDTGIDPLKAAFFPSAALIFRAGDLPALPNYSELNLPTERPWEGTFTAPEAWKDAGWQPDLYKTRVALRAGGGKSEDALTVPAFRVGMLGPAYFFDAPAARGLVGPVGGKAWKSSGFTFDFPAFGKGFASAVLVSRDGRSINASQSALFTLGSRAENLEMVWNASRSSVGDQWGKGPVHAEGVPCKVTIPETRLRRVWALDPSGKRKAQVPAVCKGGRLTFSVGPQYRTLWYELTR